MGSYDELTIEMKAIQQRKVQAKKGMGTDVLKEVKRLCKEFSIIAKMLRGALTKVRGGK